VALVDDADLDATTTASSRVWHIRRAPDLRYSTVTALRTTDVPVGKERRG